MVSGSHDAHNASQTVVGANQVCLIRADREGIERFPLRLDAVPGGRAWILHLERSGLVITLQQSAACQRQRGCQKLSSMHRISLPRTADRIPEYSISEWCRCANKARCKSNLICSYPAWRSEDRNKRSDYSDSAPLHSRTASIIATIFSTGVPHRRGQSWQL